ncbi:unnamed protein product [Nippostrongylus brasiliensis]|uniref:Uncharacterized protein n=1 Tax=Nippostrongylus brasiliensis TaxID=27835 RepID=A0A0N4YXI4_NIPBR|nr:unnamed protein product [Nippostrongylus brasiliensis]
MVDVPNEHSNFDEGSKTKAQKREQLGILDTQPIVSEFVRGIPPKREARLYKHAESPVSLVVPLIIDLLEPVTSPLVPVLCYRRPVGPALSRSTKSIIERRSFKDFIFISIHQRKSGRPRVTCPPHLVFDNLAHATASLIFDCRRSLELRMPYLALMKPVNTSFLPSTLRCSSFCSF